MMTVRGDTQLQASEPAADGTIPIIELHPSVKCGQLKHPVGYIVAYICYATEDDGKTTQPTIVSRAYADLIVAGVNAAKEANPENPIAAAKALPALLATLKRLHNVTGWDDDEVEERRVEFDAAIADARAIITQAEGKDG